MILLRISECGLRIELRKDKRLYTLQSPIRNPKGSGANYA